MTLNDGYLSISHEIEQRAETEFRKRKLTLGLRFSYVLVCFVRR